MTLEFWTVSGAPSPWRVALGLAFKGLDCNVHMLSAADKEHKAAAYLAINPRGTVPTLQAGDLTLRHSVAALAWLDRAFPQEPLFGDTAEEAGRIWQDTMETFEYLPPATSAVLSPIFFEGASKPTDALKEAAHQLKEESRRLSAMLANGSWLSGERPGAVDAVAFPHIRLIQRAIEMHPGIMHDLALAGLDALSPDIAAWVLRVEALPHVAETFPPHWADAA